MDNKTIIKLRKQLDVMKEIANRNPSTNNNQDLEYFQRKLQRALEQMKQ